MSWRTMVTSSRWASFGAKSTPGLPLFPNHEDPVELDDNLPSLVEAPRPDPDKSEARSAPGLPDLRDPGVRVDRVPVEDGAGKPDVLGPDLEVFEKWPVVLQRNPRSERGPRGIMNIAGRRRAAANPERRSRPRSDFGGAVRTDAIGSPCPRRGLRGLP